MSFKQKQYDRIIHLLKHEDIFNGDKGNGIFMNASRPFILQNEQNNLYPAIYDDCWDYFKHNSIAWWSGKPTNHPLSSQVACLNHLFAIRNDRQAVLDIVRQIEPDISEVLEINSDRYMPAFIQFEAVSDNDYLNEKNVTRGSNCTSVDALIYGLHKDGRRILFPIEWKYVETYGNVDKGQGSSGTERKRRYTDLINHSLQLASDNHSLYYLEPFYQLMRQTLWAEQMIVHKNKEITKADDYIHIHVIPYENNQLLDKIYPCSFQGLEATWRMNIKDQKKYTLISPRTFLSPIDPERYKNLLSYLSKRYWI